MDGKFHIVINGIEEFIVFCALVRGEALEEARLSGLVAKLHKSTNALAAAEAADQKARPRV